MGLLAAAVLDAAFRPQSEIAEATYLLWLGLITYLERVYTWSCMLHAVCFLTHPFDIHVEWH